MSNPPPTERPEEREPKDIAEAVQRALEGGATLADLTLLLHPTTARLNPMAEIEARLLGVEKVHTNALCPRGKGLLLDASKFPKWMTPRLTPSWSADVSL